jgi:hypothetical protein
MSGNKIESNTSTIDLVFHVAASDTGAPPTATLATESPIAVLYIVVRMLLASANPVFCPTVMLDPPDPPVPAAAINDQCAVFDGVIPAVVAEVQIYEPPLYATTSDTL